MRTAFCGSVALAGFAACNQDRIPLAADTRDGVTWEGDVRPIVEARCLPCHGPGGAGPVDLTDAQVAWAAGPAVVAAVEAHTMPPGGFDPDCRAVDGPTRLTDAEIEVFIAWERDGYALGEPPATAPPPPDRAPPDRVLVTGAYTPLAADEYRCFPLGDPFRRESWLTGVRAVPGNPALVHHMTVWGIPPPDLAAVTALDAGDPEIGYACLGTPGGQASSLIAAAGPQNQGQFAPAGTAIRLAAGSSLVAVVHYHPGQGATGASDRSTVELWELPEGEEPERALVGVAVTNVGLRVPAGETEVRQAKVTRLPIAGAIASSAPHMHAHGTALTTTLLRPDGEARCVSNIPTWDFGWQLGYLAVPGEEIAVSVADEVEIACTYDNSGGTEELRWGEASTDEMCTDLLGIVVPWSGGTTGGTCSGYPTCNAECATDDPFCSLSCMTASGWGCLLGGLDAVRQSCTATRFPARAIALATCATTCGHDPEDAVPCLFDTCRAEFTEYWETLAPFLADGAPGCEADYASVPELLGGDGAR